MTLISYLFILLNSMYVVAFYVSKINLCTFGLVPSLPTLTHLDLGNAIFKVFPHIAGIRRHPSRCSLFVESHT